MKVRSTISASDLESLMQKVEPRYWEGVRPDFSIRMEEWVGEPCLAVHMNSRVWYLILEDDGNIVWLYDGSL